MSGARAIRHARFRAAVWPAFRWRCTTTRESLAENSLRIVGVASLDPSSTITSSKSGHVCTRTLATASRTYRSPLYTGIATDTTGTPAAIPNSRRANDRAAVPAGEATYKFLPRHAATGRSGGRGRLLRPPGSLTRSSDESGSTRYYLKCGRPKDRTDLLWRKQAGAEHVCG